MKLRQGNGLAEIGCGVAHADSVLAQIIVRLYVVQQVRVGFPSRHLSRDPSSERQR